jgi:glucose-1-phosphate adenylyltransferase
VGDTVLKQVLGIINLGNEWDALEDLTSSRCLASVPFGGQYRLIDFPLSNMVNSGIRNIAVLTLHKYRSLMNHLGNGKEWDLAHKQGGLVILPGSFPGMGSEDPGDVQTFLSQLDFFQRSPQPYVLISGSRIVCNIDYHQPFLFHQNLEADITVLYKRVGTEHERFKRCRRLKVREDGRITAMEMEKGTFQSDSVSMDMFILKQSLFLEILQSCAAQGYSRFIEDGIARNLRQLSVYGYEHNGHISPIHSVTDYYEGNMQLLQPAVRNDLLSPVRPIYTKVMDEPPVKYLSGARVENSLVSNGCVIDGTVENCVLFPGVKVHKGAYVKNSILLHNCEIAEDTKLDHVILCKDACLKVGWIAL